ncbi:putative ubiquitin-conjugating enzyme E2 23 [Panicum miliaceum]|uniref:Ubiquitin-conjugating enzyme E2 23 n=1 Tax=Panicum miliaceum TaxID=4540 RepID=A0A3L6SW01_PANMI|nr:putative ubiquitin-conjugating enzyme E2 23 [Panicum miliaceum]
MEDASGRSICQLDLVAFKSTTGGAHGDRGRVLNARPGEGNTLTVLCVDGGKVRVVQPGDCTVVDRSYLYPGIVVASASDPGGQLGVVTGVDRVLDLVRLDGENAAAAPVAGGVSPGELRRVRALSLGDYVVSGPGSAGSSSSSPAAGPFFKASRWLKGYWKPSRERGTVARVEMAGVLVYWVASSSLQASAAPPASYQKNPQNLSFFCSPPSCYWSIGDRCFFRTPGGGHRAPAAANKAESSHRNRPGRMAMKRRMMRRGVDHRSRRAEESLERPVSVANTRTTADVLWQDGTRQRGVASASLLPFVTRNEHDFLPGQHVVRVRGGDGSAAAGVSNDDDLSWVGHVSDLCEDGHVLVKWGNGNTTKVSPHEIAVVKLRMVGEMLREMGDWAYDDGDIDDAVDNAQEETAAQVPAAIVQDNGANGEGDDDDDDSDTEDGLLVAARAMGPLLFLLQRVIQIASEVLAHCNKYGVAGAAAAAASTSGNGGGDSDVSDDRQGVDDSFRFQQFEVMLQSPPDHHYLLDNTKQLTDLANFLGIGGGGKTWIKRVHKEWNILENSLPDTVYVRAYEDRMDLLRVVMVGASGTPYHDGLFFFDLQLPPSVNYRSFGLRVNPNLYPSGTVCLSLLGTFGGQGDELWSPEASSVLQVVVSIQGLVLNAQPYYNEAGYEAQVGTPEGRRNELPYSENTYLLNLQTMIHLLRRPPAGFEDFVRNHFLRRGRHVLLACEAYLEAGRLVGTLGGEPRVADEGRSSSSAGFRLALANVVPQLVEAFTAIGADGCEEFDRPPL